VNARWMPAAAILMTLALLFAGGCGRGEGRHAGEAKAGDEHKDEGLIRLSDEELARAGVKVTRAGEEEFAEALTVTATVEANPERVAHVLPRVPGRVLNVGAKLGDRVKQGQTLAVLDSIEVAEAQSAYAQVSADAAAAKAGFERAERLHGEQIIPAKEHQRARAEHEKTRAALQGAADRLKALGVHPGSATEGMGAMPVAAPLAGTVTERKAVLGELAKPDEALFVIADLSKVWLSAHIAENQLGKVSTGAKARARLTAYPDQVFEGKVNLLGAALDKETRTAKAIIELDNAKGLLRPFMFATVQIETGRSRKLLALPESAVTLVQGVPTVFVEEAAGFEARPVELGERSGGKVTVKSGIKPGDLVVIEGVYTLKARLLKSQIGEGHAH